MPVHAVEQLEHRFVGLNDAVAFVDVVVVVHTLASVHLVVVVASSDKTYSYLVELWIVAVGLPIDFGRMHLVLLEPRVV